MTGRDSGYNDTSPGCDTHKQTLTHIHTHIHTNCHTNTDTHTLSYICIHTLCQDFTHAQRHKYTCTTIMHSFTHTDALTHLLSSFLFLTYHLFFFVVYHSGRPMSITNRSLMNDRIRGSLTSLTASLDLAPVPHTHSVPAPNQGTCTPCVAMPCLILIYSSLSFVAFHFSLSHSYSLHHIFILFITY